MSFCPQAKRESETRLMEKLEKERALAHELTSACSNEEAQVTVLRLQLQETAAALAASQGAKDALQAEVAELRRCNKETGGKLTKQATEMSQLQEMQVDLMSQIGSKNEEFEQLVVKFEETTQRYEQETQAFHAEKDQLLQEVAIAQENIAELLGAKQGGFAINAPPITANQEPPTLPATHINMVDKSAYEALQQAYENIEELYHKCREDNKEWRVRYVDIKGKHDTHALKNAELQQRIQMCKQEYEAKAHELVELKKNLHGGGIGVGGVGGSLTEVTALQDRLREMEENQCQVTQSWEVATKELASRKEELKQRETSIAELEQKTLNIVEILESVQTEYREFQNKHDKVLGEKIGKLDQKEAMLNQKQMEIAELHATLNGQAKEKSKLESTVKQLREQLEALKEQARSSERSCPVCNTKFPGRISQQDFEKHVQGHFNGV